MNNIPVAQAVAGDTVEGGCHQELVKTILQKHS
jgi:hypothetical protein